MLTALAEARKVLEGVTALCLPVHPSDLLLHLNFREQALQDSGKLRKVWLVEQTMTSATPAGLIATADAHHLRLSL